MSARRRLAGLLGAFSERLRGRNRGEAADALDAPASTDPKPTAAERLDEALAGLRERIPEPGDQRSGSGEQRPDSGEQRSGSGEQRPDPDEQRSGSGD
jgi:hypothetical protein